MADFVFKYKGWALSSEYLLRITDSAITTKASETRYVYSGQGVNTQLSYCFKRMWEIGLRHSLLVPNQQLAAFEKQKNQYGIVLSKYILKHKLKVQTDFTYERQRDLKLHRYDKGDFQWRFQIELGI